MVLLYERTGQAPDIDLKAVSIKISAEVLNMNDIVLRFEKKKRKEI